MAKLIDIPANAVVSDAPAQMERETERLRAAAGRPGEADLESMLAAAAGAWPDGQGPVSNLRFEPGKLSVAAVGWAEPQVAQANHWGAAMCSSSSTGKGMSAIWRMR